MSDSSRKKLGSRKSPTSSIVPFAKVKFVTCVPRMPLSSLEPWIVMFVNEGLIVLVKEIASSNVPVMTPPEPLPPSDA